MAGATSPTRSAWPIDPDGLICVRLGCHAPNGLGDNTTPAVIDSWIADYDCEVLAVYRKYYKTSTNHADLITLTTIDATKLTLVAQLNASADIANVKQTLHSDIGGGDGGVTIVRGNGIELSIDTSQTAEAATCIDTIWIRPLR